MAVLMTAEIPGATVEQYQGVNDALGITAENPPDGFISHVAAKSDDGIRIVDVWESEGAFNSFIQGAMPTMQKLGIPPFEPQMYPVHNTFQGAGTEANVVLIAELPEWGPEAYDRLTSTMDAHADGGRRHPSVMHTAAVRGGGLYVVDVWDAPESFGRFAEEQFPDGAQEEMGRFEPQFLPVINLITARTRASV